MIYLVLASLCSSGVSLSIRYAEQHSGRMKSVTVVNYIASVFWCFYFLPDKHLYPAADGQAFVLVLSIINGCLYLGTLLLQQVNIRKNGTTISASFSHMGVLVPSTLHIFVWGISGQASVGWSGTGSCGNLDFKYTGARRQRESKQQDLACISPDIRRLCGYDV